MNDARTTKHRRPNVLRALAVFLCLLAVGRVHGGEGLYAIAGVPLSLEDSPAVLYRVEDGGLAKVRTIATLRQNPRVVRSYPEKGFVFVVSEGAAKGSFLVDILDLGDMSRERSVDFDTCDGCIFSEARLLERNGRLIFYVEGGSTYREGNKVRWKARKKLGLDMHSGEFVDDIIDRLDEAHAYIAGAQSGGVDGSDFGGGIYVRGRNPERPYVVRGSDTFDLRWRLPAWFSLSEGGRLRQEANNDHARVLRFGAGAAGTSQWLVFDKSARRWSSVPMSTFLASGDVRLLGRWLVREDVRDGYDAAAWRGAPGADPGPVPFWPSRMRRDERPFWSAEVRADVRKRTPTGRLQFHDTRTGNLALHDAGNLDSETLLIDGDDAVYFRVGDELRRGDIGGGGLANVEVVATAPEMLVVHWLVRGFE